MLAYHNMAGSKPNCSTRYMGALLARDHLPIWLYHRSYSYPW